jgi:hypothetical protein
MSMNYDSHFPLSCDNSNFLNLLNMQLFPTYLHNTVNYGRITPAPSCLGTAVKSTNPPSSTI